ncbi:MAG: ABC transporter permease [Patescibacteria group bacterium]|jgi:putative ABC transport system permease protein|nr:ABC transporter permease [Patescibacteria group bacterium]
MIRVQDSLKLSTRMFKTKPARTWLTIVGIGVGIAAVVVLVGLGYGLQGVLLEKIVFGEALLSLNVGTPPSKVVIIDDEMVEEFYQLDNVEAVEPMASFTSLVTLGDLTGSIMLQGARPAYFSYAGVIAAEGSMYVEGDKNKIAISAAVLKLFGIEPEDAIGQGVRFKVFIPKLDSEDVIEVPMSREYIISAVVDDQASLFAYIPLTEFEDNFAIPYYEKARVKIVSNEFLDTAEAQILDKGFMVTALSKTVDQANKIFKGIQATLATFGGIALIVSAIGMFNTMTVTLLERTKEIGIMRTIGGSPSAIKTLFLTESVIMGFLGGIVGMGIGVGGGLAVNFLLNSIALKMGGTAISLFRFPIPFLTFIAIFSAVMGFLTGLFPAQRAAKLSPLEAIRYS